MSDTGCSTAGPSPELDDAALGRVLNRYAADVEKYGKALDSGFVSTLRTCSARLQSSGSRLDGCLKRLEPVRESDSCVVDNIDRLNFEVSELKVALGRHPSPFPGHYAAVQKEARKLRSDLAAALLRLDSIAQIAGGDYGINTEHSMERIYALATGQPMPLPRKDCPKCGGGKYRERGRGGIVIPCEECGGSGRVVENRGEFLEKALGGENQLYKRVVEARATCVHGNGPTCSVCAVEKLEIKS